MILFSGKGRCWRSFTQPTLGNLTLLSSIRTEPFWLFVEYEARLFFLDLKRGLPKCFRLLNEVTGMPCSGSFERWQEPDYPLLSAKGILPCTALGVLFSFWSGFLIIVNAVTQHLVVDESDTPKGLGKYHFLFRCRIDSVSVCLIHYHHLP